MAILKVHSLFLISVFKNSFQFSLRFKKFRFLIVVFKKNHWTFQVLLWNWTPSSASPLPHPPQPSQNPHPAFFQHFPSFPGDLFISACPALAGIITQSRFQSLGSLPAPDAAPKSLEFCRNPSSIRIPEGPELHREFWSHFFPPWTLNPHSHGIHPGISPGIYLAGLKAVGCRWFPKKIPGIFIPGGIRALPEAPSEVGVGLNSSNSSNSCFFSKDSSGKVQGIPIIYLVGISTEIKRGFFQKIPKVLGGKTTELKFLLPKSATKMGALHQRNSLAGWKLVGNKFLGKMGSVLVILVRKKGGKKIFLPFYPIEKKNWFINNQIWGG